MAAFQNILGEDGAAHLAKSHNEVKMLENVSHYHIFDKKQHWGIYNFIVQVPYREYQCDLFLRPKPKTREKHHKATWQYMHTGCNDHLMCEVRTRAICLRTDPPDTPTI